VHALIVGNSSSSTLLNISDAGMEGGVDTEERSLVEAQQDRASDAAAAAAVHQETEEDENKFQKAIGAWRSKMTWYTHILATGHDR
jgi:hypothetical protein